MSDQDIVIRKPESPADYLACQVAQRLAWGIVDDSYVVPIATMVGAQLHGGLVLGAFLDDGQAAGLSFAFLGKTDGELCLYSQLTGVVPGHQDKGLGHRLKVAQREFARSEGIPTVAWAFDPLQAGNARFNLNKLGATAQRYHVDMYGPRTDAINRNAPTDRLIARWETTESSRPIAILGDVEMQAAMRIVDPATPAFIGLPHSSPSHLLLGIPADIKSLRDSDSKAAAKWLLAIREGFQAAFEAGYRAVGIHSDDSTEEQRFFYVLERQPDDRD